MGDYFHLEARGSMIPKPKRTSPGIEALNSAPLSLKIAIVVYALIAFVVGLLIGMSC